MKDTTDLLRIKEMQTVLQPVNGSEGGKIKHNKKATRKSGFYLFTHLQLFSAVATHLIFRSEVVLFYRRSLLALDLLYALADLPI